MNMNSDDIPIPGEPAHGGGDPSTVGNDGEITPGDGTPDGSNRTPTGADTSDDTRSAERALSAAEQGGRVEPGELVGQLLERCKQTGEKSHDGNGGASDHSSRNADTTRRGTSGAGSGDNGTFGDAGTGGQNDGGAEPANVLAGGGRPNGGRADTVKSGFDFYEVYRKTPVDVSTFGWCFGIALGLIVSIFDRRAGKYYERKRQFSHWAITANG